MPGRPSSLRNCAVTGANTSAPASVLRVRDGLGARIVPTAGPDAAVHWRGAMRARRRRCNIRTGLRSDGINGLLCGREDISRTPPNLQEGRRRRGRQGWPLSPKPASPGPEPGRCRSNTFRRTRTSSPVFLPSSLPHRDPQRPLVRTGVGMVPSRPGATAATAGRG